jgi:hypothetical protein
VSLTMLPFNRANRALNTCPSFIKLRATPRHCGEPRRLNFCAFCKGNCVVDIDAEIANGILNI